MSTDKAKISAEHLFDDELKQIIDTLNNNMDKEEAKQQQGDFTNNNYSDNSHSSRAGSNDPNEKAYRTLGISPNASIDEIKTAYKTLIKQYHPDKVQNLSKEEQAKASQKAKDINEAYSKLEKVRNF